MLQIGIVDINKTPSILDKIDEVAQIVNKKSYRGDRILDGLDDKY